MPEFTFRRVRVPDYPEWNAYDVFIRGTDTRIGWTLKTTQRDWMPFVGGSVEDGGRQLGIAYDRLMAAEKIYEALEVPA